MSLTARSWGSHTTKNMALGKFYRKRQKMFNVAFAFSTKTKKKLKKKLLEKVEFSTKFKAPRQLA